MYPFHHCTISSFLFHCNYSNCHRQSSQFSFNDKQKQWREQLIYVYSAIQKIVNYQLIYKSPFFNYVAREVCTFALYLDISTAMESEKNDWIKSITFWSPLSLQIRPDNKLIRQRSIDLMWCLLVTWDAIYVKLHKEISLEVWIKLYNITVWMTGSKMWWAEHWWIAKSRILKAKNIYMIHAIRRIVR